MVASAVFFTFREPSRLVRTSWTPANSKITLVPGPAIIPVPGLAGLSSTFAPPYFPMISWGMVFPDRGTRIRFFFASAILFTYGRWNFICTPKSKSNHARLISHDRKRIKTRSSSAFANTHHTVDIYWAFFKFKFTRIYSFPQKQFSFIIKRLFIL